MTVLEPLRYETWQEDGAYIAPSWTWTSLSKAISGKKQWANLQETLELYFEGAAGSMSNRHG